MPALTPSDAEGAHPSAPADYSLAASTSTLSMRGGSASSSLAGFSR